MLSSDVKISSGRQGPLEEDKENKKFKWDKFDETSSDNISSTDIKFWKIVHKAAKVVFAVILFAVVLTSAVLHKSTVFLLLSNIAPPNALRNSSLKTSNYHLHYHTHETSITYIWALVLIVVSPYVFTFLSSLWSLIFKKSGSLEIKSLLITLILESLHSAGINFLAFGLLPNFDPLAGLTFCLNIVAVPAVMKLIYVGGSNDVRVQISRRLLGIVGIVATVSSMAFWAYYIYRNEFDENNNRMGLLIVSMAAPLLISLVWWENFIPKTNTYLRGLQSKIQDARDKIYSIVSLTKIIITVVIVTILYGSGCEEGSKCLEVLYGSPLENVSSVNTGTNDSYKLSNELDGSVPLDSWLLGPTAIAVDSFDVSCSKYFPFYIAIVNVLSGLICYRCCIAANQILAKIPCFSLPLVLATPVTLVFMIALYTNQTLTLGDSCIAPFPKWEGGLDFDWTLIAASILGFTAIVTVTGHIWIHNKDRMQNQERMFVMPMYCGLFLDQSLILNRKRAESDAAYSELGKDDQGKDDEPGVTPKIYLCATMWHENENEMTQLLKSLFRLDIDQFEQWEKNVVADNPDFYKFEAHIFFDDAFETKNGHRQVNIYVRDLIRIIDNAHQTIYGSEEDMKMDLPSKVDTPYGGRLVWSLPFKNKLIVHLKDKEKIRHRKRWSQVMYMYYLLSYKLRDNDSADNTFILALDGDVDFQPSALKLLVDIMKQKSEVGAACGRILPIGTGPMVWYQKFEYAVSHWLQKATEHTLGCVLCSPGCFSLFRGSHLMANNVMKRYTTAPTEARHYVQYDQGEDRWLCTLMLQQGYRVEYCAASDALTYAPEGFYEFYNQRRRWTPSTMANILDLLLDFKNVTERNNDISMLYIGYQMLLMVSSILTPGTIFLMILGAINMAYPSLSLYWALILNLIPVAIFIIFCFLAKPNTQLAYAAVLSTVYSLVMMLVIVGLIKQAADNGFCSVTTVFLIFVAGVFVIAAFIHPQEFWCILHGFLYFLAIPSMSMLLMLYSIGNLHVVSWGTRETAKPAADQRSSAQRKRENSVKEWLGDLGIARDSEYMFSFGNLFRCICCPDDKRDDKDEKFEALLKRFDDLESTLESKHKDYAHDNRDDEPNKHSQTIDQTEDISGEQKKDHKEDKHIFARDKDIKGKKMKIKEEEKLFWEQLIKTYLFPLNEDKEHQKRTQSELIELRNKVCLFFILTNALFVTIVFSLQQVNLESGGSISKELPCADGNHGGSFEPISMAFTGVFGVLLFVQFLCMIFHRMSTFLQICSITEIGEKHHDESERIAYFIKLINLCKNNGKSNNEAVCNSEDESEDAESDDLEGLETTENERRKQHKPLGPRGRFKQTFRILCDAQGSRALSTERQIQSALGPDVDKKNLKDMTELVQDHRFQKTIRRRGDQMTRQRTMKARKAEPSTSATKQHLSLREYGRKHINVDLSDIAERF